MLTIYNYAINIMVSRISRVYFPGFIILSLVFLFAMCCSSPEEKLEKAKEHYAKGRDAYLLFSPKGLQEAITQYENAIELDRNYAPAYSGLGEAYSFYGIWKEQNENKRDSNIYDKSIEYSQKAIELAPDSGDSHRALASSYRALGKVGEARKEAEKAIELNSNDAEAYYVLWTVTGADVDSKYIKKALDLSPNLSVAHNDLGYIYYTKGEYDEASEHLRRALEINPELLQAYNNLGLTLVAQKKFEEAEKEYRKAIDINPDYLLAHYNLGVALGSQGKFDEAISEFEKTIEINPDFPEAYITLALSYESKGERDKAVQNYQNFIDLSTTKNPRYEKLVAEAKNRIKNLEKNNK